MGGGGFGLASVLWLRRSQQSPFFKQASIYCHNIIPFSSFSCNFLLLFMQLLFSSFSSDDDDYEGYEYSLSGQLSEVRIVYLNRFIQEVS